jgi:methylphosphotriester-DNA--protein-cysteine methyltransferase
LDRVAAAARSGPPRTTAAAWRPQEEIVVHINEKLEAWSLVSQQWTADASRLGRSPTPRARRLRQRSLALTTLLLALRKRLAEADQLAGQITTLIADEAAADLEEGSAAA